MSDKFEEEEEEISKPLIDFGKKISIKNYNLIFGEKNKEKAKICLELDLSNTLDEASRKMAELGYLNRNKKPIAITEIRKISNKFIVSYPDEAREVYNKLYSEYPHTPEGDANWMYTLISVAVRVFGSKADFIRWAVGKGVYRKGFKLFYKHFNLDESEQFAFDDILEE